MAVVGRFGDPGPAAFVARVFALRRSVPELRRDDFFYGRSGLADGEVPDIVWLSESARELGPEDWATPRRTLVVRVRSAASLLVVLHAGPEPVEVTLPGRFGDTAWARCSTRDRRTASRRAVSRSRRRT